MQFPRKCSHFLGSRGEGMPYCVKLPWGVTTASVWIPRRCDILTPTPTWPAPPGPDPMPLVTDTSAACLRTVTVCVHVLLATRVNSFFRIPSNRGSSFNKHSCHRISKVVTCIESSGIRPDSQPYDPTDLRQSSS